MTITYIGEMHAPATNNRGSISLTRAFRLKTSAQSERAYHVGSHASLPVIGEVHPDCNAWCASLNVDPTDPWKGWTVTAEYSTEWEMAEDPTAEPARITWNSEQFQRPAIFDINGQGIVNSAGDPFDPPNMMDDSRRSVSISKNLAVVPAWILSYQDAVNSDAVTIDGLTIAIGRAKIQAVSIGEVQSRNGISFRTVSFTIHFQKSGWFLEPLDAGFREIEYGGGVVNILNSGDDELPSAPVPLNGSGVSIPSPTFANVVFGSFEVYSALPFASLPLT